MIAQGRGWLAVEKPSGMSVHNEPGADLCTLWTDRLVSDSWLTRRTSCDLRFGLHPVHRLDRDTSGIVLLACRPESLRSLMQAFQDHRVEKEYIALVHGDLSSSCDMDSLDVWEWPLTKGAGGRRNPAGSGHRVACRTDIRVIGTSRHYTLIRCHPVTGRKHQIRRHAKLAGHPVVGDRRYGSPRSLEYLDNRCGFRRLALHAQALRFKPPGGSETIELHTAETPTEMVALFEGDR